MIFEDGQSLEFDKIFFACNADQALGLLARPSEMEKKLLGAWRYTDGLVTVHRNSAAFPPRSLMSGYIFLYRRQGKFIKTSISAGLWNLPGVSNHSELISSQHRNFPLKREDIIFENTLRTPIFDFRS